MSECVLQPAKNEHQIVLRLDRVVVTRCRHASFLSFSSNQQVLRSSPGPLILQATVTVAGRHSGGGGTGGDPYGGDGDDDDDCCAGGMSAEGGSSAFMCTPQSFPPTPVSRAHVMARTSQFSDDILFLARDQLRLGENLKPGVDETVRSDGGA